MSSEGCYQLLILLVNNNLLWPHPTRERIHIYIKAPIFPSTLGGVWLSCGRLQEGRCDVPCLEQDAKTLGAAERPCIAQIVTG